MTNNPLVIYHGNCYDGFTAAWIVRKAYPSAEFFAGVYGEEPPNVEGKQVYIVDFSYPRDIMIKMQRESSFLKVLDHHKTAEEACEGLEFCTFDMNRSGCRMAWDYFINLPIPHWILAVEDRDLWRFNHPYTKNIHAFIASWPMIFENWDMFNAMSIDDMNASGASIRRYINTYIEKAIKETRIVETRFGKAAILNIPYQNASETATAMLESHPEANYSVGYFQRADTRWQYSLRSRSDFDVSRIAKDYDGGGHAQAAGFDTEFLIYSLQGLVK